MNQHKFIKILVVSFSMIILFNCDKMTEPESNWGNADFSSFVAIGNSLTAGVADGALYEDYQKNSFPNLIATMAEIEDDFEQPIMGGNGFSFKETDVSRNLLCIDKYRTEYKNNEITIS